MLGLTFSQLESIGFRYVLEELSPSSAYGELALRGLRPFARGEERALEAELENVARLADALPRCESACARLERVLMQVRDISRTITRCGAHDMSEVELFEIKRLLLQLQEIEPLFAQIQRCANLEGIFFHNLADAFALLDPDGSGVASFHISERHSAELAGARRQKREIEALLREHPDDKPLQDRRRQAVLLEENAESDVRARLSMALEPYRAAMLENTRAIARLDLTLCKARLALRYGGVKPRITAQELCFEGLTNPAAARDLEVRGKSLTPVSISLAPGATVITGANMGGKSMALKTLALNALLAQCGFFPFARAAEVCLFDSMHMLSDDLEDSTRGLSSFGGEITALNKTIKALEHGFALVILDELARGTNPLEGAAIARAVAGYLDSAASISLLATHFGGVAERVSAHYQVIGLENVSLQTLRARLSAAAPEKRVEVISSLMDYGLRRVARGSPPPRDALTICRLLGLREEILNSAEQELAAPPQASI